MREREGGGNSVSFPELVSKKKGGVEKRERDQVTWPERVGR